MSVVSVNPRSFILALFIRDDGERFLLGDKGYDFKDSQLHFAANTIENDEVMKQGADGVMVAGQVRRASVQSFDGFVGDATMAKETIEQMRRDFFAFFVKGHHFRVIYVDCNRNAWQRKGGYLVDAPEVKELWQIHPEYHVGLNFEDVNYYSYDEDADGEEILSNLVDVPVSTAASGGLVWDEAGAVSEDAEVEYISETAVATPAKNVYITDAAEAPLASFQLDGETSQNGTPTPSAPVAVNTTTGENVVQICGKNLFDKNNANTMNGYIDSSHVYITSDANNRILWIGCEPNTSYAISAMATGWNRAIAWSSTMPAIGVQTFDRVNLPASGTSTTFTTGATAKYLIFRFWASTLSAETYQQALDSIQIELGSTATAYEPYKSQSYEVNLGKNLFDKDNYTDQSGYYIGGSGKWTSSGATDHYFVFRVEPNTTYTFSKDAQSTSNRFRVGIASAVPSAGSTFPIWGGGDTATEITLTTASDSKYAYVYYSVAVNVQDAIQSLQIEVGSQKTSYAAYFEPIELCKIGDYQDYIYKSGDKWYVHKEIGKAELGNGSNWRRLSTGTAGEYRFSVKVSNTDIPTSSSSSTLVDMYSNYWLACTRLQTYQNTQGIAVTGASDFSVESFIAFVDSIKTSDVNGWKAWLTANMPVVYYPSTIPTDTEITNEALIAQLEAVLGGHTYAGTNNITTITPNEQGTLEISYYTKYQPVVVGGGYVWEAGGSGGATVVVNNSIDNVSPIWKIYGPTTNPQLENSTTGEVIEYVGVIAEGQTLTIDMGEQTASLDGLNVISNLVGDFISLAPGANRLIYSVLGDAGASSIGWSEIVG